MLLADESGKVKWRTYGDCDTAAFNELVAQLPCYMAFSQWKASTSIHGAVGDHQAHAEAAGVDPTVPTSKPMGRKHDAPSNIS